MGQVMGQVEKRIRRFTLAVSRVSHLSDSIARDMTLIQ
jgi:hypothetical protein